MSAQRAVAWRSSRTTVTSAGMADLGAQQGPERGLMPGGSGEQPESQPVPASRNLRKMAEPTPFDDLNHILGDLVASIQTILGENFCGAYLVGSFAIGDADIHSDVDFIVATHDEVTQSQQKELQEMHRRIYRLNSAWAQHLEGSYIPKESLRRLDPNGRGGLCRGPRWNSCRISHV